MIPKSIAGPGLLAHVLTAKFVDGTPFYRQESQFARITVEIKRATMCNWAMKVAEACAPLIELLREEVIAGQLVNCDETRLQVLDEPGRAATDESYMWVFVGGPAGRKAVLFEYSPSRGSDVPLRILKGYHGAVQCDGYVAYDCLVPLLGVTLYGCWAHARRKFVNILKALEKLKPAHQGGGIAQEAVDRIRLFYAIDASARKENLTVEDTLTLRQRDTKPKFESMKTWLEGLKDEVPPRGLLGQAIRYALGEWPRLERIADTGFVPLDNNVAENAIRPFVIGRKNWLFAGTPEGAKASATLYSLIETAKANGLEPFQYLRTLFEHLPTATTVDQYRLLLPQYLERDLLVTPKQPVLRIPSPYG
jgi:transposase